MPFPTLFTHYREDQQKTQRRYKFDLLLSVIAVFFVMLVGIWSIADVMSKTTYEGVCADADITSMMLCDEWIFHHCSYFGEMVGTKPSTSRRRLSGDQSSDNNQVVGGQRSTKEECEISQGGGCPVFDVTSKNFCTNYKGGHMSSTSVLYTYRWTSETEVEFSEIPAGPGAVICCGQIAQSVLSKLGPWLGMWLVFSFAVVKGSILVGNMTANICHGKIDGERDVQLQRLPSRPGSKI